MVHAPEFVRAFDHLKAPVLFICSGERHHYADQLIRKHKLVFIPIAIILVPFPRTTYTGLLLHKLGMKMADRCIAIEKWFYGIDHSFTSGHVAKDVIAGREPQ